MRAGAVRVRTDSRPNTTLAGRAGSLCLNKARRELDFSSLHGNGPEDTDSRGTRVRVIAQTWTCAMFRRSTRAHASNVRENELLSQARKQTRLGKRSCFVLTSSWHPCSDPTSPSHHLKILLPVGWIASPNRRRSHGYRQRSRSESRETRGSGLSVESPALFPRSWGRRRGDFRQETPSDQAGCWSELAFLLG
jgi:hypothetical protein